MTIKNKRKNKLKMQLLNRAIIETWNYEWTYKKQLRNMRAKTMSKNYYDDEILFVDVENGDIHLKEGVKRMNYPTLTSDNSTQINYWESAMKKIETFNTNNKNWDNVEG